MQATVDGHPQQILGRACRQSDGTWRVTEGPEEQPDRYAAVYPAPPYWWFDAGPYPYSAWYWGPPLGLSFGAFVVLDRHRHFHQFPPFGRFALHHPGGFRPVGGGFGGGWSGRQNVGGPGFDRSGLHGGWGHGIGGGSRHG